MIFSSPFAKDIAIHNDLQNGTTSKFYQNPSELCL